MDSKDVVIIGAGPAGIATAIQLKRCSVETVLLEQEEIGGLLRNANFVENYPGFPEGISGPELVELFKEHLKKAGINVSFERVLELESGDEIFFTRTSKREIRSKIVVIATGTKPKKIPVPPVSDEIKDRIFYEIYPIIGIKNKKVIIIGAGDAAFDYALNLSNMNEVVIVNRSEHSRCLPLLMERCMKPGNISYLCNTGVNEINDADNRLLVTCIRKDSRRKNTVHADYVVFAVGREPCLDFTGRELKNNLENLIKADRLYMVGDVKNKIYRQTAICVGDGIKAAMKIYNKTFRGGA